MSAPRRRPSRHTTAGRGAVRPWVGVTAASLLALPLLLALVRCPAPSGAGEEVVLAAWEAGRSGLWVEVEGEVDRLLPDDTRGSRHQRFILRLPSGHTLLVAHNIDLAPRAPLDPGRAVKVRGEYEWNEQGGVLHWTHHDPRGRHAGGYLRVAGETYR